jgi:hypothetical protein
MIKFGGIVFNFNFSNSGINKIVDSGKGFREVFLVNSLLVIDLGWIS